MADVNEMVAEAPAVQQQGNGLPAEVKNMMDIALNGGFPPKAEVVEQVAPVEQPQNVPHGTLEDFSFDILKEKFGYQKPEDAFKEIEELRQFKAAPPKEDFKFANEQSEKLAKAFQAGELDKVYSYLNEQRQLDKYLTSEVTDEVAGEIIKLGLKTAHKDLTDAEIDYKFNKQYGIPKEPQGDADDDDFIEKHKEWEEKVADIKMSKIIDAKLARPQLETAKINLVLPDIIAPVDEKYVEWQKLISEQEKLDAVISEQYQNITPKDVETELDFTDEANKIAFKFQYEPDSDSLKQTADLATDIDKLLQSYVSDGKFDKQGFLKDIHFAKNREKILMEAMKQAKNAAIRAKLPDNSNGGLNRQLPEIAEPTELDKQMNAALGPYTKR